MHNVNNDACQIQLSYLLVNCNLYHMGSFYNIYCMSHTVVDSCSDNYYISMMMLMSSHTLYSNDRVISCRLAEDVQYHSAFLFWGNLSLLMIMAVGLHSVDDDLLTTLL